MKCPKCETKMEVEDTGSHAGKTLWWLYRCPACKHTHRMVSKGEAFRRYKNACDAVEARFGG